MIRADTTRKIEQLRAEGYGIRRIARALQLSRNTVREVLDPTRRKARREKRRAAKEGEGEATKSPSLLAPHEKFIEELLEEDARRLARKRRAKPLTTIHILKEIQKRGYRGGRTIVDDFVRARRGPRRRDRRPYARFETIPAEEAQQDWSPYTVELGGKLVTIQVFSLILAWSRQQFLRAYLDNSQPTLLWGHAAAFRFFEGVPWRIVYDRQKAITPFDSGGKTVLHEKFRNFAEHYGFEASICRPRDKERKGKVERPFGYFETSFLPRRSFASIEDLNRQIEDWLGGVEHPEEGNRRVHGTTGEVPHERWLEEKEHLLALPSTDFVPRRIEQRQVEKDSTLSFDGTRYSVPARLVEKGVRKVWVSASEEELVVHDAKGEVVAEHRIDRSKKLVMKDEHYAELRQRRRDGAARLPDLERQLLERFEGAKPFLDGLKTAVRSFAPIHLREIIALTRRYRREAVAEALERAVRDGTTTAGYVRQLLEREHPTGHLAQLELETPRGLALGTVDPGSAEHYSEIFTDPSLTKDEEDKR